MYGGFSAICNSRVFDSGKIRERSGKMKTSLPDSAVQSALRILEAPSAAFARRYPGETGRRQPVHVVYGGAHLFRADITRRLGELALATLQEFAPDAFTFARAIGLPGAAELPKPGKQSVAAERLFAKSPEKLRLESRPAWMAQAVYSRVLEKLQREPVEDFRIDFEDGYGNRPDAEEDQHAKLAAREVARGFAEGSLPPFIGIRLKPFSPELRGRSMRTLDIFLSTMCEATGGQTSCKLRRYVAQGRHSGTDGRARAPAGGHGTRAGPRKRVRCDSR